jgi:hypothetical protein
MKADALGRKPSANILDMKYLRWQATGRKANKGQADAL